MKGSPVRIRASAYSAHFGEEGSVVRDARRFPLRQETLQSAWRPVRARLGRARRAGDLLARRLTVRGRRLPDFVILGAQKAGTSSLHAYLMNHPRVASPLTKELHYFDLHYAGGLRAYRACFPRARTGVISGEATPYYLVHPAVPRRVATDLPAAKFIVLLRNPIDRAISQHNHERARGFEPLPLEEALEAEQGRLAGEGERLERDPSYHSFSFMHHSYVTRGLYAEQLTRWFSEIDRSRFLIVQAEALFERPQDALDEAHAFLGLPPHRPADLRPRHVRAYRPGERGTRERLRDRLRATFAPHNERLYELLGVDYGWD